MDELRRDLPFCFQLGDILALEVGDTDALRFAFFIGFFQLTVSRQPIPRGLMDIEQIDIVDAEAFECFIDRVRVLIFAWPELGREENILALCSAFLDTASDRALIDIRVCRIDERLTHFQRFTNAVFCV